MTRKRKSRKKLTNHGNVARDPKPHNLSRKTVQRIWRKLRQMDDRGFLRACGVTSWQLKRHGPVFTKVFLSEIPTILANLEKERWLLENDEAESRLLAGIYECEARQWLHEAGFSLQEVLSYTSETQKAIVKDIRECQFTLLRKSSSVRRYIRAVHRLEYIWLSDAGSSRTDRAREVKCAR